jgi:hypothetical protein
MERAIEKGENFVLVVASPHFGQLAVSRPGHGPKGFWFPRPIEKPLTFCRRGAPIALPCKRNKGRGAIR